MALESGHGKFCCVKLPPRFGSYGWRDSSISMVLGSVCEPRGPTNVQRCVPPHLMSKVVSFAFAPARNCTGRPEILNVRLASRLPEKTWLFPPRAVLIMLLGFASSRPQLAMSPHGRPDNCVSFHSVELVFSRSAIQPMRVRRLLML